MGRIMHAVSLSSVHLGRTLLPDTTLLNGIT
jgi:hypothetical protein